MTWRRGINTEYTSDQRGVVWQNEFGHWQSEARPGDQIIGVIGSSSRTLEQAKADVERVLERHPDRSWKN